MGASPSAAKAPLVSESVDKKPSESSPLVSGGEAEESEGREALKTAIALFATVSVAVLKTQITAELFRSQGSAAKGEHAYTTAYSLWSCVVTCLMLVPCFLINEGFGIKWRPASWAVPTRAMLPVLAMIVGFTALDLAFTNIALANVSTAVQQCIAATNPFWSICFETALYSRFQHPFTYLTITCLVAGGVFAAVGSFSVDNAFGIVAAVVAVLSSSSKYVFTHKAFQGFKKDMGPLSLLFWVDLALVPIYSVWALVNGELSAMWHAFSTSSFAFWANTGVSALGGLRALTQYFALVFVSATSLSTANTLQQILNILISIPIQHTDVTSFLIAGIVLVITFSSLYTVIKTYKPLLPAVDKLFGIAPTPDEATTKEPAT